MGAGFPGEHPYKKGDDGPEDQFRGDRDEEDAQRQDVEQDDADLDDPQPFRFLDAGRRECFHCCYRTLCQITGLPMSLPPVSCIFRQM